MGPPPMMTCRDVSTLVSRGGLAEQPTTTRVAVWLHLAMCRHCRAFRRQLEAMASAAQRAATQRAPEPQADFERRIVNRLLG